MACGVKDGTYAPHYPIPLVGPGLAHAGSRPIDYLYGHVRSSHAQPGRRGFFTRTPSDARAWGPK